MESVFVVTHLNVHESGREDIKMIGCYRSESSALAAVERLKNQPGFCEHPRVIDPLVDDDEAGFYIGNYELDKVYWTEGYGFD